ncbi:MAG: DUF481 domain-containing protein [Halioglobus sp.]|nr:DUF481 domain-containing protein [Halioglobus sp.]
MLKTDRAATCAFILLSMSCITYAGELRLNNGAILPGELASIGDKTLVWKADKIGDVTVSKSDVIDLQTSSRTGVEIAPQQEPQKNCLVSVLESVWSMDCAEHTTEPVTYATLRSLPPDNQSSGKFSIALDLDRGANPSDEVDVDMHAKWLRPTHRHTVELSVDYETSDNDTTEDQADTSYQYDLLRDRGWFWYGRVRYYRDKFEALQQAYSAGAGIGREFTPVDALTLTLQGGPMGIYFQYEGRGWFTEPAAAMRTTMAWDTPWYGIKLSHSSEFGYVFDIDDGYILQTKSGLTFPLYEGLIAEVRLDYDRSGVNAIDGSDYDTEWVLGLGYTW